ncbi:TIGR00299 family protein, partial [Halobacteriales archaeon QH_2_66_30]
MVTLAFDGRTGASGDMLLGALLAAGADRSALDVLERELGVRYDVAETTRCGISATRVEVVLADESTSHDRSHDQSDGGHSQDHSDEIHSHEGTEGHAHEHTHAEGHGPERSYGEVVDLVESMGL